MSGPGRGPANTGWGEAGGSAVSVRATWRAAQRGSDTGLPVSADA